MNRDVTITQTDVTLRRNDRPIELTRASAEIVAVGVAGATGATGATGVVAATDPIVYTSGTQTVSLSTSSMDAIIQRDGLSPLRRWHRDFAGVRYARKVGDTAVANVLWVGDSIGEGFNATTPFSQMMPKRFATNLAQIANANGRIGQYVVGYRGSFRSPRFTTTGTVAPTAVGTATKGLGLQALTMTTNATASITFTGTGCVVYYRRRNAVGGSMEYTLTQGATPIASGSLATFSSAVGSAGTENVAAVDLGGQTRGTYTLTITASGGTVVLDGAYLYDGDEYTGVRVYNSSLYGTNFDDWKNQGSSSLGTDAWQALRTNLYDGNVPFYGLPVSLVVLALGSNETAGTDFTSKVTTVVSNITAAVTAGGNSAPSFALLIPPSNKNQVDASWTTRMAELYAAASTNGWAVWDWAEVTGSVKTDPFGWTDDQLHPINAGHLAVGDFAASKATEFVSSLSAVEDLRTYVDALSASAPLALSTARALTLSTGTGLTTSAGALVPDFGTTTGKVAQGDDSRFTNARTPTAHASTHATGGSDPLTAATTSVAGIVQLTDSTTSTSTSTAATANAVKTAVDRVRDSLSSSSSALDVYPRTTTLTGVPGTSGTVYFTFFTPATNMTITTISYAVAATTSSGLTLSRFGLYTFDGTTATLVARTNSTATTTFNTANTVYARTFDTTGGYPSSYDLVAGSRYAIALIGVGTTPGNVVAATGVTTVLALAPRLNGSLASQSDLPTSTSSFGAPTILYWGRVS